MPENKFEKKVQQQMEELRLPPGPFVWLRVEEELKKKKKRRTGFFFLLLAGLVLLGYCGYLLASKPQRQDLAEQKETVNRPPSKETNSNDTPATQRGSEIVKPVSAPVKANPTEATKAQPASGSAAGREAFATKTRAKRSDISQDYNTPSAKTNVNRLTPVLKKMDPAIAYQPASPAPGQINTPVNAGNQPARAGSAVLQHAPATSKPDTLVTTAVQNKPDTTLSQVIAFKAVDSLAQQDSNLAAALPGKKAPALRFGIDLSGGITTNRGKLFSLGTSNYNADYSSNPSSAPGGGGGSGQSFNPPSSIKAGPSFRLGGVAELSLSARSSLTAGLRYMYVAEKIKVGNFRDTGITSGSYLGNSTYLNGIYRGQPTKSHTNQYHFIELPLSYQLLLNQGHQLPVTWSTGLSASYLVATNALVYDTAAGGIYVHNVKALNRFQAYLHTGLSFGFGKRSGFSWSIGPELSASLTQLVKPEPFIRNRYLLYGGIAARFLFHR